MQLLCSLVCYLTIHAVTRVGIVTAATQKKEQKIVEPLTCQTNQCYEIAGRILSNRNSLVNPCDDFYEYACGSWNTSYPMLNNVLEWSEDDKVSEKTLLRIKDVLEEQDNTDDTAPVRMAKQLYRSCMDTDEIEKQGVVPIQDILDSTGGFPVMKRKGDRNTNILWQDIDRKYMTLIGNSIFFNMDFEKHENDTSRFILKIDQDIDSPFTYYVNKKLESNPNFNSAYVYGVYKIIETFLKSKRINLSKQQVLVHVVEMLHFGGKVLEISEGAGQPRTGRQREVMTIEELQLWYDRGVVAPTAKINFLETIQEILKLGNVSVDASEPIVVYNKSFLRELAELLGQTDRHIIVNYVQWNLVNKFLSYTTKKLRSIKFNMYFLKYNVTDRNPRWKVCVKDMEMKDAVSYMFVKKYVSDSVINNVTIVVDRIQDALETRIKKSRWASVAMKDFFIKKVKHIKKQVGYPDWYKNTTAFEQRYKGLTIGSEYFQNILNCRKHELKKIILEFRGSTEVEKWLDYPITLNAFYSETTNAIIIPAAELQDPYFSPSLPESVNYGTAGFIVGHELSHCLDSDGIRYDETGRWVTHKDHVLWREYKARAACFRDQYSNYMLPVTDDDGDAILLDGEITANENIADSSGLKLAYAAHRVALKARERRTLLPGLEKTTEDQLFFLSFANAWCTSLNPEYVKDIANIDEHSPPKIRVIGAVSNMRSFTNAFKCPPHSPMNPVSKCNLWK